MRRELFASSHSDGIFRGVFMASGGIASMIGLCCDSMHKMHTIASYKLAEKRKNKKKTRKTKNGKQNKKTKQKI